MEGPFPVPQQGEAELGLRGEGSAECCLCGGSSNKSGNQDVIALLKNIHRLSFQPCVLTVWDAFSGDCSSFAARRRKAGRGTVLGLESVEIVVESSGWWSAVGWL